MKRFFKFVNWDYCDELVHVYTDIEFIADLGPWKAGQKFAVCNVDYSEQIIQTCDQDGKVLDIYTYTIS